MKATYNYNRAPYFDTGKSKIKFLTCGYWEVPAHPSCLELLESLIEDAAKFTAEQLKIHEANQIRRARMTATLKKKRLKKLAIAESLKSSS
tara:strand:- start:862 stop:1134 length:273 start_codon:yes stop_codon:yes gene_type:complete